MSQVACINHSVLFQTFRPFVVFRAHRLRTQPASVHQPAGINVSSESSLQWEDESAFRGLVIA